MKKLLFIICGALLILLANSCGTPQKSLYTWGNYQSATYKYVKNNTPEDEETLLQAYQYILDNQKEGRKVVPPGICADYGFLLVKKGKIQEGIELMKLEIILYPESAVFVERIIKRLEQ